jgi:hypothetical protein
MPQLILNRKQVEELTAEVLASGGKVTPTLQECRDAYGLDSKKDDNQPTLFSDQNEADVAE